jgi:hypothetical protein
VDPTFAYDTDDYGNEDNIPDKTTLKSSSTGAGEVSPINEFTSFRTDTVNVYRIIPIETPSLEIGWECFEAACLHLATKTMFATSIQVCLFDILKWMTPHNTLLEVVVGAALANNIVRDTLHNSNL